MPTDDCARAAGRLDVLGVELREGVVGNRFSKRYGFAGTPPQIRVREDAPDGLRYAIADLATEAGMRPSGLRAILCKLTYTAPDSGNWSEYPNIWEEVQRLIGECDWFRVYDAAELIYKNFEHNPDGQQLFENGLNDFFIGAGIGWEMVHGEIVFRGDETFVATVTEAGTLIAKAGYDRAAQEIHEALADISRRPSPDITGAIQHSMAALECTARQLTGEKSATLGQMLKRLDLPKPLDVGVEKLWSYASDKARHIREGETVGTAEAELVVSVACAACSFLLKRDA